MRKLIYLLLVLLTVSCMETKPGLPETFDYGTTTRTAYKNNYLGLEVRFDTSWMVQEQQLVDDLMDEGTDLLVGDNENMRQAIEASKVNSAYLLTLSKHGIGADVLSNPSLLLIAENTKNYPSIKTGEDYLKSVSKLLRESQVDYEIEDEFVEKTIGNAQFHVMKASLYQPGLIFQVKQEYLATIKRGFCVGFVITYYMEDEREELYQIIDRVKM